MNQMKELKFNIGKHLPGGLAHWGDDLRSAFAFLTRLPVAAPAGADPAAIAKALRLSPVVGAFTGAIAGSLYWLGLVIGLSPFLSGLLSVLTAMLVSGALHEIALCNTAEGFGGGWSRQQMLDTDRHGPIGAFGALALLFSVLLRSGAIAELSHPGRVFAALVAAGALAQGAMYISMALSPGARVHGINAVAGRPQTEHAMMAAAIALLICIIALPISTAMPLLLSAALSASALVMIASRQTGGHNNDILGAVQQIAEISMLLVLTALLTM